MFESEIPVIVRFERTIKEQKSTKKACINRTMFMTYQTAKETGNRCLDLIERN
jgi:hypothetical protein